METLMVNYRINDDVLLPPNGDKVIKQTKKLLMDKIKVYMADKVLESFSYNKSIMFYDATFELVQDYDTYSSILSLEVRYEIADASSYAKQDTRITNNKYNKFDLGVADVYEPKQEPKREYKEKFKLNKKIEPKIKHNKEKFEESDFFDDDDEDTEYTEDIEDTEENQECGKNALTEHAKEIIEAATYVDLATTAGTLNSRVLWDYNGELRTDTHIKYSDYENKVKKGEKDLLVKFKMNVFLCDDEIHFSKYDKMPNNMRIGFVYKVDYFSIIVSISGKLYRIVRDKNKTLNLKEVDNND